MNFFEIMKYFVRAIEQMRAVDGILIPQFPWPNMGISLIQTSLLIHTPLLYRYLTNTDTSLI